MRVHELGAHRCDNLVLPVLNERQFPRIEHHAHRLVLKEEFLVVTCRVPRHFAHFMVGQVTDEQSVGRVCNEETIFA